LSNLKLSVLDQSPVHDSQEEKQGLFDTIELAKMCDTLGYHRYFLAEHHNSPGYASSCPEIMVSTVANHTKNMRIGSGGVMLNHYSPFKVAETFNMLCALHPNRIDLGIGRASGANFMTSRALHRSNAQEYPQKAYELIGYLNQSLPLKHDFHDVKLTPSGIKPPPVYLLGSSEGSSQLAGVLGAGFILALFIGNHYRSPEIIQEYKQAFSPTNVLKKPKTIIAVACIVADTIEEARYIASSHTYWKLQAFTKPMRDPLIDPKELQKIVEKLSEQDKAYYEETMNTMVLGTATQCKEQIVALAKKYEVDEVMIVNVSYHFEDRKQTYKKLAEVFNITQKE